MVSTELAQYKQRQPSTAKSTRAEHGGMLADMLAWAAAVLGADSRDPDIMSHCAGLT